MKHRCRNFNYFIQNKTQFNGTGKDETGKDTSKFQTNGHSLPTTTVYTKGRVSSQSQSQAQMRLRHHRPAIFVSRLLSENPKVYSSAVHLSNTHLNGARNHTFWRMT